MSAQPIVIHGDFETGQKVEPDWTVILRANEELREIGAHAREVYVTIGTTATTGYLEYKAPLASSTYTFDRTVAELHLRLLAREEERKLAERFIERARNLAHVEQIWASWEPTLEVTVVVSEREMESELHLYAIFRDEASALADPSRGDLFVVLAPYQPENAQPLYIA
jgi:hypothetical protein